MPTGMEEFHRVRERVVERKKTRHWGDRPLVDQRVPVESGSGGLERRISKCEGGTERVGQPAPRPQPTPMSETNPLVRLVALPSQFPRTNPA